MNIVIAAMKYDYGIEDRGYSYEYQNLFLTFKKLGYNADFYDTLIVFNKKGKDFLNKDIIDFVTNKKADLIIISPYQYEFALDTIKKLGKITKTLCYFLDDPWRINFAKYWVPYFHYISSLDIYGERKYREISKAKVIYSPFACNTEIHKKKNLPKKYDVTFVGSFHPYRAWFIKILRKKGINVKAFGSGWNRHHSQDEMVDIFNQTKINLNLSNNVCFDIRYLFSSYRALKNSVGTLIKKDAKFKEQLKIRHFEINGCKAFQLCQYAEGLEHCYEIGKEIVIYTDINDLIYKVKYYLAHEDEREEIASLGYQRTIKEHTYEKRLEEILKFVGLNK